MMSEGKTEEVAGGAFCLFNGGAGTGNVVGTRRFQPKVYRRAICWRDHFGEKRCRLELTLPASPTDQSSEGVSGRLLGTPPEPLTGSVAENGDLRLQGAGLGTLTLRGHLPNPSAPAQPAFTGTTGSG